MQIKNLNVYFFILILLGITGITYFLFQPFLSAIIMAAVIAVTFHAPYQYLLKKIKHPHVSSLLTCLLVLFVIVLPVFLIMGLMSSEINDAYQKIVSEDNFYQNHVVNYLDVFKNSKFSKAINLNNFFDQNQINKSVEQISSGFLSLLQTVYQNVVGLVIWIFVMFFTLYYFLVENKTIIKKIMYLSPLKDEYEVALTDNFSSMVAATLKGTLVVGVVQGILGGLMFAVAGIPSFIIWGIVMILFSVIPAVGSGLIWVPMGIIMLFGGHIWQGIFIFIFGSLVISTIDNILRTKLVGRDTAIHPLLVFFATLGGIMSFGILGFIIGPVIMALFLTLWDIYGKEFGVQLKKYNA
ncbi:MAG: AI-2E family transporter [Parcubacteria group bacterium]|jgi:predicted PurR-regulated permease PerM